MYTVQCSHSSEVVVTEGAPESIPLSPVGRQAAPYVAVDGRRPLFNTICIVGTGDPNYNPWVPPTSCSSVKHVLRCRGLMSDFFSGGSLPFFHFHIFFLPCSPVATSPRPMDHFCLPVVCFAGNVDRLASCRKTLTESCGTCAGRRCTMPATWATVREMKSRALWYDSWEGLLSICFLPWVLAVTRETRTSGRGRVPRRSVCLRCLRCSVPGNLEGGRMFFSDSGEKPLHVALPVSPKSVVPGTASSNETYTIFSKGQCCQKKSYTRLQ